ncbi:hypothetical protein [Streptomyces sp. NPDC001480]|uniref:hypothetical protein n=1 Tax=Streptomyces sp. NPDC001480 TaxID=3364577 RepID=UPI00367393DE
MTVTMTGDLSGTLHRFLTRYSAQARNKEIARTLVEAAGRGEPNAVARHWSPGTTRVPALACDSILAEDDRVTLRISAVDGEDPRCLVVELRFDDHGRLVEHRGFPVHAVAG